MIENREIKEYKNSRDKLLKQNGIIAVSKLASVSGPVNKIHYYEAGVGEPLIIVHGGGSHALQTYPLIKALQSKYHLFIVDRPGCGLSDSCMYSNTDLLAHSSDFILSFMKALKLETASLLGSSMGGLFTISFALANPDRVEKLILVGHPAGLTSKIPMVLRLLGTRVLNRLLMKLSGPPSLKSAKDMYRQLLVADITNVPDHYLENDLHAAMLPGTGESFISLMENMMTLSGLKRKYLLSSRMKELTMPTLFVIGDKDNFDSLDNLTTVVSEMADARIEVVKGAGHIPWFDKPAECSNLIENFLE